MLRRDFLAAAIAATLGGCGSRSREIVYRFTLEVETPEGIRTGSSLLEVGFSFNDGPLGGVSPNAFGAGVGGEATIVDLGERGLLFCLLSADHDRPGSLDQDSMISTLFAYWAPPGKYANDKAREAAYLKMPYSRHIDEIAAAKPRVEVPIARLPRLVRFRDTADRFSLETVDPRDLAATYGPGVRLVRAGVEVTEGKPTRGIEKILPWAMQLNGSIGRDLGIPFTHPLRNINDASFWRR